METQVAEIAPDVYRLPTYVGDANLVFNQFLVDADERGGSSTAPTTSTSCSACRPAERDGSLKATAGPC